MPGYRGAACPHPTQNVTPQGRFTSGRWPPQSTHRILGNVQNLLQARNLSFATVSWPYPTGSTYRKRFVRVVDGRDSVSLGFATNLQRKSRARSTVREDYPHLGNFLFPHNHALALNLQCLSSVFVNQSVRGCGLRGHTRLHRCRACRMCWLGRVK